MPNDFRALLSTFEAATGTRSSSPRKCHAGHAQEEDANNKKKPRAKDDPLREMIKRLWDITQIRQSMQRRPAAVSSTKMKHSVGCCTDDENETRKHGSHCVHLAICLVIVDHLPHEDLWKHFLSSSSSSSSSSTAEIFVHAKHPNMIKSEFVRSKLIDISHKPEWNDVRVVQAILSLIDNALDLSSSLTKQHSETENGDQGSTTAAKNRQRPDFTHVLLGTESCVPLLESPQEMSQYLEPDVSYLHYYTISQASRFEEREIWDNVNAAGVVRPCIVKALPGWSCLAASHARDVWDLPSRHLDGRPLYLAFQDCWAPEEVYFSTCLALLGHLPIGQTSQEQHGIHGSVRNKALTYAEWDHRARNHEDRAHPRQFSLEQLTPEFFCRLRREGFLILRKVKNKIPLDRWLELVRRAQAEVSHRHSPVRDHGSGGDRQHSPPASTSVSRCSGGDSGVDNSSTETHVSTLHTDTPAVIAPATNLKPEELNDEQRINPASEDTLNQA